MWLHEENRYRRVVQVCDLITLSSGMHRFCRSRLAAAICFVEVLAAYDVIPSLTSVPIAGATDLIDEVVNGVGENEECAGVYNLIEKYLEEQCPFILEDEGVAGDCPFPRFVGLAEEMRYVAKFFILPTYYSVPHQMKSRQPKASVELEPGVFVQPWLSREEYLGVH